MRILLFSIEFCLRHIFMFVCSSRLNYIFITSQVKHYLYRFILIIFFSRGQTFLSQAFLVSTYLVNRANLSNINPEDNIDIVLLDNQLHLERLLPDATSFSCVVPNNTKQIYIILKERTNPSVSSTNARQRLYN